MYFTVTIQSYNKQSLSYFDLILRNILLEIIRKRSKKQSSFFSQSLHGKSKEKFQRHVLGFEYLIFSKLPVSQSLMALKSALLFLPSGCQVNIQIRQF